MNKLNDLSSDSRDLALDKLFENAPLESEVLVELPSKGKFYRGFTGAKVSPLLFEDEQRILLSKNKGVDPINELISKCVTGVNIRDLVPMDKLYLLLKIREVSYGEDYKFDIPCPKCGANTETIINTNKHITVNFAPDNLEDPREIELPVLKKKAVVRFPRVHEEHFFEDPDSAITNIYRCAVSIDGNEDPVFISKALKRMNIRDVKTIVKEIQRHDLGVDPTFQFECPSCGHNDILRIPFDYRFFSVS